SAIRRVREHLLIAGHVRGEHDFGDGRRVSAEEGPAKKGSILEEEEPWATVRCGHARCARSTFSWLEASSRPWPAAECLAQRWSASVPATAEPWGSCRQDSPARLLEPAYSEKSDRAPTWALGYGSTRVRAGTTGRGTGRRTTSSPW